jgi:hypothetical protein
LVNLGRGDQFKSEFLAVQGQKLEDFPHVKRWLNAIAARPTIKRAYELAKKINTQPSASDEASQKKSCRLRDTSRCRSGLPVRPLLLAHQARAQT